MIPKIIHYCWFGGAEFPDIVKNCIESWKKYLPEYEVKFWNESTFPLDRYPFAKEALENKKYAFVSDVCRLAVLHEFGGIYLDTDVEVLGSLDQFLHHNAFSGFEDNNCVPTGIMASEKGGNWAKDMLAYYEGKHFIDESGRMDMTTNVIIITEMMKDKNLQFNNTFQEIENYITFYPSDYFCPKSHIDGKIRITSNSITIHHFAGSWLSESKRKEIKIKQFIRNLIGNKTFEFVKRVLKK